jgi:glycosyltransferase involved in cell wall biosynthesis
MPSVCATIVTLNAAAKLPAAVASLSVADELLVVDSGSTDGTPEIARNLGGRVLHNPWPGYAAQKNFAALNAQHDWILSLDADEALDEAAYDAVRRWKGTEPTAAGYRLARRAFYLGRWIAHSGWYPDYKLRLYDRRRGKWEGDFVHESVRLDGPVLTLEGAILHNPYDSLEDHYRRIETYTDLSARELFTQGRNSHWVARHVGPPWKFFSTLVLKAGFLDGSQGIQIARAAAYYVRRKHEKLASLTAEKSEWSGAASE